MLQKFKVGIEEGVVQSLSSLLAGIILNTLYMFGIIGEDAFVILLVINLMTIAIITSMTIRLGFLFLIGWIIGILLSYTVGVIDPFSLLIFILIPTVGFFIGVAIKIGILLLKIFLLIILSFIALVLILSLFI